MPVDKCANAEPIRGYRLVERLGAGGFGEVWKCEAPGGIFKAAKFVYGSVNGLSNDSVHAEEELRAFQLIKSIRHPFLLSIDRVEVVADELVIITELADQNLHELFEKYQGQGNAGIPREELLGYMQETAEVLDLLNQKFNLQHLDIKPRNLFLVGNHVKVADFGLVNSLTDSVTTKLNAALNAVTPLYAAPELFVGQISRHCDQYSLAIAFQELLTGTMPFAGKNFRQLLMQHTHGDPDLSSLSARDREIVGRALAKKPEDRFASCLDFVRALRADASVLLDSPSEPNVLVAEAIPAETIIARLGGDTERVQPPARPALPSGVLTDHRFVERLSNSPLMEVWKAQLGDGAKKRVQLLFGLGNLSTAKAKETLARLQSIHHPALLSPSVAHGEPGRLVLVTDYVQETLRHRAHEFQARRLPGVPRGELVEYIRAAAEVLDYLYQQHNIQHLNLSPRSLLLDNGWLQIDEFGYAQLLWTASNQDDAQRNARYAAPELFTEVLSRHCDQYSLALIYAEMLTGVHPFRGLPPKVYLANKMEPDLDKLLDVDRMVLRQALHPDPNQRWSSCTEMLLALEGTSLEQGKESKEKPDHFGELVATERNAHKAAIASSLDPDRFHEIITDLIESAGGQVEQSALVSPELTTTGDALRYQFNAGLPLGAAQEQLLAFARSIKARMVKQTEAYSVMQIELPRKSWRWWEETPKLELRVEMARVNLMSATPIEVKVQLSALHCLPKDADTILNQRGEELLNHLQQRLLINSEKRAKDRLLWPHPVKVIPIDRSGQAEEAIECRGKDLSLTGVGFYLPHELMTADVLIELPNRGSAPIKVPAKLVRVKCCADGWYEVGALFRLPVKRRSMADISFDGGWQ